MAGLWRPYTKKFYISTCFPLLYPGARRSGWTSPRFGIVLNFLSLAAFRTLLAQHLDHRMAHSICPESFIILSALVTGNLSFQKFHQTIAQECQTSLQEEGEGTWELNPKHISITRVCPVVGWLAERPVRTIFGAFGCVLQHSPKLFQYGVGNPQVPCAVCTLQ